MSVGSGILSMVWDPAVKMWFVSVLQGIVRVQGPSSNLSTQLQEGVSVIERVGSIFQVEAAVF